ncbi:MAG TPA: hypothetical protein VFH54_11310 [Mycobacteriales bacterium]|nr:hypothetical protein [Mycobacteriales bacterium]
MTDTISSDDGLQSPPPAPTPRREPFGPAARTAALATAALLVAVGGVVTAAIRAASSSTTPDELVPASAFAYAQLDLDPGNTQTSALRTFLNHFPGSPSRSTAPLRDALLGAFMKDSSDPHVDYTKDVKPWLGDKAAVAGWLDSSGHPQVEYLLQSTNDAAARKSLHQAVPQAGLDFRDGYAILASSQPVADAAVTSSRRASLGHDATYRADVGALGGGQIVLGWADAHGIVTALQTVPQFRQLLSFPGASSLGLSELKTTKGRVVVGAHAADNYVEVDVRQKGLSTSSTAKSTTSALLTGLPSGTLAAAEIGDPGGIVTRAISALRTLMPTSSNGSPGSDPLVAVQHATGLSLPGDATTVFGSGLVVSYGGLVGGLPNIGVRSKPADLAAAEQVAHRVSSVLQSHAGPPLAVSSAGGDLVVATSPDYADAIAHRSGLGNDARFKTALGAMPGNVTFAAYVDLGDILPLFVHGNAVAEHFDSVGMWASHNGDVDLLQVRLVAR